MKQLFDICNVDKIHTHVFMSVMPADTYGNI